MIVVASVKDLIVALIEVEQECGIESTEGLTRAIYFVYVSIFLEYMDLTHLTYFNIW